MVEWELESETRKKIDEQLKKAGWIGKYIREETNSVKSDFVGKEYVLRGKTEDIERGMDRFIDYLLLSENNSPLAIIESKRFSKDPEKGRIQARTYSKDIELQTHEKVPIFLTNSERWVFIDQNGVERKVSGPFTQEDLARRKELFKNEKDLTKIPLNPKIIDRPKLILNLKILAEHFENGNRSALIQMATGTGKTRLAMALIDLLDKGNRVRNVLFLVDRVALANQASSDGFRKYFREPVHEIHLKGYSKNARFYASTIQTIAEKKGGKEFLTKYSPGFFDLIIFDEAHRSLYDKNNLIHKYFDALKVGLTATPRGEEARNTYELFECRDKKPTVEYSYEEAVNDKVLVPYSTQIIETEILALGIKGKELTADLKDQLRRQEEDPERFEVTGKQFDYIFMDDKTNELIVTQYLNRCYRSEDNLPCKTIFFCASQKHANKVKSIFGKLAPKLSGTVQVIVSEYYRAGDEVKRFKLESEPRIALSVGMLDTGIDIPEVCNLVFVKPVYSAIRFWQMLGRGTRNFEACKHPEWLPNRNKDDFLILDFAIGGHSNVDYHKLKKGKEAKGQESTAVKIFTNRVKLLKDKLDEKQKKLITEKIMADLKLLDEDSFIIREKLSLINKLKKSFSLENYIKELNEEVAPLFLLVSGQSSDAYSFILQVERLFGYILKKDFEKIGTVKEYVCEKVENILQKTDRFEELREKEDLLNEIMQEKFWDEQDFEKVEVLVTEVAPLMKYYQKQGKQYIQVDKQDKILNERTLVPEVQDRLREQLEGNPTIQKIRSGTGITSKELLKLEEELLKLNPAYTIENIQRGLKKDFLTFISEIVGLSHEWDPKSLIEKEFDKHIIENSEYNSRQIEFLQVLKKVFADKKHIELKDFAKEPLSNEHPLDKFQMAEIEAIVRKCGKIRMK